MRIGRLVEEADVVFGSKAVSFTTSKCFPVCASKQTQGVYEYTP